MPKRCNWCEEDTLYQKYHDEEWGKPIYDDHTLFECLVLESFQAGLNWITILRKRENFRKAFDNFDYHKIAQYKSDKIEELMSNEGIIRHRAKILATINNAQCFIKVQKEYGNFSQYIWAFSNDEILDNQPKNQQDIPSSNALSDMISKDLKKNGFKFLGSTTIYAYLQAIGIINDHIKECFTRYENLK